MVQDQDHAGGGAVDETTPAQGWTLAHTSGPSESCPVCLSADPAPPVCVVAGCHLTAEGFYCPAHTAAVIRPALEAARALERGRGR